MAITQEQLDILKNADPKDSKITQDQLGMLEAEPQRIRQIFQGLSLNTADEIEAFLRTGSIGGEDYKKVRDEIREKIKAYQTTNPKEAFAYEIGGAVVPTIAAALVPGGQAISAARTANLVRMGGRGLAEGAMTGYGASEEETIQGQLGDAATGGAVGAISNPLLNVAGKKVVSGVGNFVDSFRQKFGVRPSDAAVSELQRIAEGTGKSLNQIIQDIDEGRILAEDPSLVGVVRAIKSKGSEKSGDSGARIIETLTDRASGQASKAGIVTESVLDPGKVGRNVYKRMMQEDDAIKRLEGEGYKKVFGTHKELNPLIAGDVEEILKRFPEVRKELQSYYQESGQRIVPLFVGRESGEIEFARMPSLEDAEVAYRLLRDKAGDLYSSGSGTRAENYKNAAASIKNMLDDNYGDLKQVRLLAASRRSAQDAFKDGSKAFGRNADEIEFEYEMLLSQNPEAAKAFKSGVLHSFRNKMKRSVSVSGRAADPDRQEGAILKIVAGDDYTKVLQSALKNAGASQEAMQKIVYNSQTAAELAARQSIGSGKISMAEMASIASGNPAALMAMVSAKLAKSFEKDANLTPKDYKKITDVLLSEDSAFVNKMINDEVSLGDIKKKVLPYVDLAVKAGERGARYEAATGGTEFSRDAYKGGLFGLLH